MIWAVVNPIVLLLAYTFVFSVVFKAKWNLASESKVEFALVLFAGLLTYNFFADCVGRAPMLVVGHANYVKKVVFPLEILPVIALGTALFQFAIGMAVWLLAFVAFIGVPPITLPLLLPLTLPLMFFMLGLSYFLSALGVYLRDTAQFVAIWLSFLMFLSPIFYPLSAVPEAYVPLIMLNPMTFAIESVRDVMYWGQMPSSLALLVYFLSAVLCLMLGYYSFQRARRGFSDVL